jgi:two-component system OmpR family sensor kinase
MLVQSIRFRITLVYTIILTLTLLGFSLAVYQNFSRSLRANLDGLLKSKAEGVADSIEAYWAAETTDESGNAVKAGSPSKVGNINFLKIAQRWIEEESNDPALIGVIVQVFRADGGLIAASRDMPLVAELSRAELLEAARGRQRFHSLESSLAGNEPLPLRLFLMPVLERGRVTYIVQVGGSLYPVRATLNRLKALLFLVLPLTVILTGLAGLLLVRMTLKPVDRMVGALHEIQSDRLSLRLPLPRSDDELRRLATTFNDLLARLEKDFLSQQQFSQDLSHELRTPLTILKGDLEVTLKKSRSPQEYEAVLKSSLEEIDTISGILDNLLMLARWENREIPLRLAAFDLRTLAEQVLSHIRVLAEQKRIRLSLQAPAGLPFTGDEAQLRTALTNLLDNGIKYSAPGGRIGVRLADDEEAVRIVISDQGLGIPENKLPRIFDRFYRVEDSRTSPGFGLGLSIVKSIVEAHRGRIEVESRPGHGTVFSLIFPRSVPR